MPQKQKTGQLQRAATTNTSTSQFSDEIEDAEAQTAETAPIDASHTELRRAVANPPTLSPGALLTIQRSYGNQAAIRMIQRSREQMPATIQRVGNAPAATPENYEMMRYLTDLALIPYFKKFVEKEFSDENFLAFHAIRHFKKNPSLDQATKIYEQYIKKGAPKEGNFNTAATEEVEKILNSGQFDAYANTIFDRIEVGLIVGLSDTFQRFQVSKEYKESKSPTAKLLAPINMLKGLSGKREGHMNKQPKGYKGEANI